MVESSLPCVVSATHLESRFISPPFLRLQPCGIVPRIAEAVIHGRHLECLADIDIPRRIPIELIVCLELRHKDILILYRVIDELTAQAKRNVELRCKLLAVRSIKRISRTHGRAPSCRRVNRLTLVGISKDKRVFMNSPVLLDIKYLSVHCCIGCQWTVCNEIVPPYLAVGIAEKRANPILLSLIDEACCVAIVAMTIIVFGSLGDKRRPRSILVIASAAARDISVHIIIIQRNVIRKLCHNADAIFLSFADPPVNPRDLIYAESIGVRHILRPFAAHINDDTISDISCIAFLKVIAQCLTELKFRLPCRRFFQDNVNDAAHCVCTVEGR